MPFRALSLALVLTLPQAATAAPAPFSAYTAQVTDVADAADIDNPFDFRLSVGFSRTDHEARIERENVVNGRGVFANELNYSMIQQQLDMRAEIGIYHDLSLSIAMPYIFTHDSTWSYANNVNTANSSVTTDPTTGGALFSVPYKSSRRGLDHLDLGLNWSPFNDARDDTKPTWTIRIAYGIPIGPNNKPTESASANNPGGLSDHTHQIKLEMDLSKRMGYLDPYVGFKFMDPITDGAGVHNLVPPLQGGFFAGLEIVPWENIANKQRLSFDFRASVMYYSGGRYNTELSDPLHQLTYAENYVNFTGGFHLLLQPIEYFRITAGITYGYDTAHMLTTENVGNDVNGDGVVDLNDPKERSPLYNAAIDSPGHRFRLDASTDFTFYVALALTL